ncbi:hypothetical protein EG68_02508 [Paragonimus skrjabini miyazakii]|uniref:Actin interacting protein 3-like C-terminal domain-containing protein n=1 Tax=Paragonimus skrjabini miyazakii TaxID=59628 RepID=A0A8S9Z8U3_9TREM|nr:hypothetical protein EG68_02508 [Paragonimus skrjabini miyazakii]
MNPIVRPKGLPTERIPNFQHSTQTLTTMDTNTKVTNSLLTSVNPTPVPCGQCSTVQSSVASTPTVHHLAQLASSGHMVVAVTKPTHTLVHASGLPALIDQLSQRGVISASNVIATSNLREVQTLPRSMEHSLHHALGSRYRPVLLANSQTALTRLPSGQQHTGPTYQMIAYPSNPTNITALKTTQKPLSAAASAGSTGLVITGMVAPEANASETTNAARIAHLLSPTGGSNVNAPLVVYYPQHGTNATAGKPGLTSSDDHAAHQPTVYYAVATSDLLRQLQGQQTSQMDAQPRQQLVQTPTALVLLQPQTSPIPASLASNLKPLATSAQNSTNLVTITETSTLPRQNRSEGSHAPGLICTCPPGVHQAIFEQQRRQKQQQQQQQQQVPQHHQPQDCQQMPTSKPDTNDRQIINEQKSVEKSQMRQFENGGSVRICPTKTMENDSEKAITVCCPAKLSNNLEHPVTNEEKAEKEAHINYLVTLFHALKASGVQSESFLAAFKRTELPIPQPHGAHQTSSHQSKQLLSANKNKLEECRRSVASLRQLHKHFKQKLSEDLRYCQENILKLLNNYKANASRSFDANISSVRADRASLDRTLLELHDSKASLTEQLHDLECVIEQTGNDVLQHRCRITLPYVQTLDSRLDSISRAVGSTCVLYPDLRQKLLEQEAAETRANELEKRLLNEQVHQLEDIGEKCKRIKGTILTLRRLAIVNVQNRQQTSSPRRFAHLGGMMNRAAADPNSLERTRLYAAITAIQVDSEKRMQAIQHQETLAKQRKRVFALESTREFTTPSDIFPTVKVPSPLENVRKTTAAVKQPLVTKAITNEFTAKPCEVPVFHVSAQQSNHSVKEKKAPLAVYSDDSLSSTTTTNSSTEVWNLESTKNSKIAGPFNPSSIVSMIDETSDSTLENQPTALPTGILKATVQPVTNSTTSPKPSTRVPAKGSRGVRFSTTVTVDDGSEVVRLNCTLDDSELGKNKVSPTEKQTTGITKSIPPPEKVGLRGKFSFDRNIPPQGTNKPIGTNAHRNACIATQLESHKPKTGPTEEVSVGKPNTNGIETVATNDGEPNEQSLSAPAPPPRRSSQITNATVDAGLTAPKLPQTKDEAVELQSNKHSPNSIKRTLPLPTATDANELLISPSE